MNEHREKYGALVNRLGFEKVRLLVPMFGSPESLRERIAKDEHLNNISLPVWDKRHNAMWALYRASLAKGETGSWSLCETVCTLKECARQIADGRTE